jgi:hypothetical protein
MMQPDSTNLRKIIGITNPLIGFYDAPDAGPFEPVVRPKPGEQMCVFSFYQDWLKGKTLDITKENFGCGGARSSICNVQTRSREDFVKFLVDFEGLKASRELMNQWLDHRRAYKQKYSDILIGPLHADQYNCLQSITFFVNPDQLSMLVLGAQYYSAPGDPPPVIAPFASGCAELAPMFENLDIPQAVIGATDIAMRHYLPPDILAFTVTKPMFQRLCELDQKSFLYKPFWKHLRKARGLV